MTWAMHELVNSNDRPQPTLPINVLQRQCKSHHPKVFSPFSLCIVSCPILSRAAPVRRYRKAWRLLGKMLKSTRWVRHKSATKSVRSRDVLLTSGMCGAYMWRRVLWGRGRWVVVDVLLVWCNGVCSYYLWCFAIKEKTWSEALFLTYSR